jgi:hypothetical protein
MKSLLQLIILLWIFTLNAFAANDSLLIQRVYAGNSIIIPNGVEWNLNSCFISDGSAYNITIRKENFKQKYKGTDTLRAPIYIPEIELLSDKNMFQYILYFKVKK